MWNLFVFSRTCLPDRSHMTKPAPANFSSLHTIQKEAYTLWQLAWPVLIGQIATVGMAAVDVAMAGHASTQDLAAVALGSAIWVLGIVVVSGIMMAINSLVAHEAGSGDLTRVPHLVRQSLWKGLGVGLVAFILMNLSVSVFGFLQLEPQVQAKASMFVHVISIGLLPFAALRALYGYSTSINQTQPVMLIAVAGLGYNIVMNWLFIYGTWGFPQLGATGCALATGSGLWLMLAGMVVWIKRVPAYLSSDPFAAWEAPHWAQIRAMLKLGLPIGVTYFAEVSAFSAVGLLVARFGVVPLSAHQIALNFSSLTFMVPLSFGIALTTRVGQALGEANPARARFVALVGVGMALVFGVLSAVLMCLFRGPIAAAYSSDPAVQAATEHLLLFAALFQLSDATQVACSCAIRGYQETRKPMQVHLLAFWGFSLPLGCVLGLAPSWLQHFGLAPSLPMGVNGFWYGLILGLSVAALLLTRLLLRISKQRMQVGVG
jgi:multidrug resistance protein, MATE family